MTFAVRYSAAARGDLKRRYGHLVLARTTPAEGPDLAERALGALVDSLASLGRSPFSYRKAGTSPFLRELLIPFGRSGYVALFEIDGASTVTVLAVRHPLEDDYH